MTFVSRFPAAVVTTFCMLIVKVPYGRRRSPALFQGLPISGRSPVRLERTIDAGAISASALSDTAAPCGSSTGLGRGDTLEGSGEGGAGVEGDLDLTGTSVEIYTAPTGVGAAVATPSIGVPPDASPSIVHATLLWTRRWNVFDCTSRRSVRWRAVRIE